MSKPVRYSFDPHNPPRLTEEQQAELRALAEMPDEEIDTSDIPPLDEEFWQRAARNPHYRPIKQQLTLRLDLDLIAWFKRQTAGGRGYQSDINRALREYVAEKERKAG